MKRSKLFLGVTGCLLAIAGIAATKTAKVNSSDAYYSLTTTGGRWCVFYQHGAYSVNSSGTPVVINALYTLQTVGSSGSTSSVPQKQPCGDKLVISAQ